MKAFGLLLGLLLFVPAWAAEQPISSGDRLTIVVSGEEELSRAYSVDQDGDIVVALIGKVSVKDLSPAQVRDELTKRLAKFVRNPQVSVEFMERAKITVGFTGAVTKPGSVTLTKGGRLLDGLAQAEGLALDADLQKATIQSRGSKEARALDLRKLLLGDAALNLELRDGDAIYVPRIALNSIRVLGAVKKPGEFKKAQTVPLLEAILSAGGLTVDADRRRLQVARKGVAEPELYNLDDVLTGKTSNIVLADGDVVTVQAIPKVTVKVFGHVAKPGESEMKAGTTVLEAVTAAGGFAMDADKKAVMLTSASGEVKRLDLDKVNSADGSLVLEPGARLFVPQAALIRYAVAGGVNQPGLFPMPADGSKIFLTDALAQAGGLLERAKKKNIVVVRKNPDGGQPLLHQVDFQKLLDPKKRDPKTNMEILASDVVIVDVEPEENGRKPKPLELLLGVAGAFFRF
jgi:protein involved in polysaccharide export with SLBB domain